MFDLTANGATKIGLLVTSIVFFCACSHTEIQQDSDPIVPVPDYASPTPEPESRPDYFINDTMNESRTKARLRGTSRFGRKKRTKIAHVRKHKVKKAGIAPGLVQPPAGPPSLPPIQSAPAPEMQAAAAPGVMAPLPPPALVEESPGMLARWPQILAVLGALGFFVLAARNRQQKRSKRRLVYNS